MIISHIWFFLLLISLMWNIIHKLAVPMFYVLPKWYIFGAFGCRVIFLIDGSKEPNNQWEVCCWYFFHTESTSTHQSIYTCNSSRILGDSEFFSWKKAIFQMWMFSEGVREALFVLCSESTYSLRPILRVQFDFSILLRIHLFQSNQMVENRTCLALWNLVRWLCPKTELHYLGHPKEEKWTLNLGQRVRFYFQLLV